MLFRWNGKGENVSQKGTILQFGRRASGAGLAADDRLRIDRLKARIVQIGFGFDYDPSRGEVRVNASALTANRVPAAVGGSRSSSAS